jgi:hypothetical protein
LVPGGAGENTGPGGFGAGGVGDTAGPGGFGAGGEGALGLNAGDTINADVAVVDVAVESQADAAKSARTRRQRAELGDMGPPVEHWASGVCGV